MHRDRRRRRRDAGGVASGRTRSLAWRTDQLDGLAAMLVAEESRLLDALAADLGKPPVEAYLSELAIVLGDIGLPASSWPTGPRRRPCPRLPASVPGAPRSGASRTGWPWSSVRGTTRCSWCCCRWWGALAAGNVVIVKPSDLAPATSAALADLLPRYVEGVAVVQGGAEQTTALLDEHLDYVFYTAADASAAW